MNVSKFPEKMIITQGFNIRYSTRDLDFLVIEKKFVQDFLDANNITLPFQIDEIDSFLFLAITNSEITKCYSA